MAKKEKVTLNLGEDLESIDEQLEVALDELKDVNSRVAELLYTEEGEEDTDPDAETESTIARVNPVQSTPEPSGSSDEGPTG